MQVSSAMSDCIPRVMTTVSARQQRSAPAREGDGPPQQGDSVFNMNCEHCLRLYDCAECKETMSPAEFQRQMRVLQRQWREHQEARRDRVIQLNDELDADLRHKMRNKHGAKPTGEGEQVPDTVRARKLRFNMADVPQPVKERELRYKEDYSQNHEGLLLQWKKRLHALSND
ncbi:hypothetical protein GWK47_052160 [Chionoecetes opilio]|uniref:Uncharacterized protein n=1 Tax=Chionoecetes opilio TaxID=41210 RepID=A0A8J4Y1J6_CHIOP|nr:hypothetical protein GWK47_052160 [Chionoecetes opilio]